MHAVLLNGHGGLDKLEYRSDVEVPFPKEDEVLINIKGNENRGLFSIGILGL